MIEGITGKVGSGKSLFALTEALAYFVRGGCVVSNIELDPDAVARYCWKRGHRFHERQYVFLDMRKDCRFHRQALRGVPGFNVRVYIDEAHLFFPAAEYRDLRKQFLEVESFVSQSRKVEMDIWLITQAWENVWGQLRRQAQSVIECRDMRLINFPLFGKALGGALGLTWTRKDSVTGQPLESGRSRIAPDVVSCYSTKQVYDDLMAELLGVLPSFQPVTDRVSFFERLFHKGPVRAVVPPPLPASPGDETAEPEEPCSDSSSSWDPSLQ